MTYVFAPPPTVSVPVASRVDRFPVHRIYRVATAVSDDTMDDGIDGLGRLRVAVS